MVFLIEHFQKAISDSACGVIYYHDEDQLIYSQAGEYLRQNLWCHCKRQSGCRKGLRVIGPMTMSNQNGSRSQEGEEFRSRCLKYLYVYGMSG